MSEVGGQLEKSDAAERLLNITLALLQSERGLTKAELFEGIRDYRESIKAGASREAVEKKFERDKEIIRETGIDLDMFILPVDGDDTQLSRYRINPSEFAWPKGVKLTPEQLQLLNLAAQVWRQASLSSDATAGLDRLRALGVAGGSSGLIGFAPRIKTHEPSFMKLSEAIAESVEVSFEYRKPGQSEISKRKVQPWQLRNVSGQWLLVCWDIEAGDVRNFLLKRIVGRLTFSKTKFEPATAEQLAAASKDLDAHTAKQIATLSVKRDSMAWFHFEVSAAGNSEFAEISFPYMDRWLLAEELRDYAGDFIVVGPSELDDAIRMGYEKVAADHG